MNRVLKIAGLVVAGACAVIVLLAGGVGGASPADLLAVGLIGLLVAVVVG